MQYYPDPMRDPGTPAAASTTTRPPKLVFSRPCPNCARFLEAARRAQVSVELVDVEAIPHVLRNGLRAVPTVMLPDGRNHVGTDAFKWLAQFDAPLEPAGHGALASSLAWSTVSYETPESGVSEALAPLGYTGEQKL